MSDHLLNGQCEHGMTAHCTLHVQYHAECVWCRTAAQNLQAATTIHFWPGKKDEPDA